MTSRFHTVRQEVHLSTARIFGPAALDGIDGKDSQDRSRRFTSVLLWHPAHTCEVRYSSIITVDTLRLDSDFRWSKNLLDGAGSLPRRWGNCHSQTQ